jgi:hypothetical protein
MSGFSRASFCKPATSRAGLSAGTSSTSGRFTRWQIGWKARSGS